MALYDVTHRDKLVDPEELEATEYIVKEKKTKPRSFEKVIRTTETALSNSKPSSNSRLIWTKAGIIFGHNSPEPTRDVNHFWDYAVETFGDSKLLYKFMGTLLMWRISLRNDTWLLFREDTDEIDPDTNKKIKICTYWIDNDYDFPYKQPTVNDLMAKFNKGKENSWDSKQK